MKVRISRGGQVSVPAAVRHRWATDRIQIEDHGDHLILRPLAADPIAAAVGCIRLPVGVTIESMRAERRSEDRAAEDRRSPAS